ncbi:hypothetical protein ACFQX6_55615 [Streptosporangium lutulentum]
MSVISAALLKDLQKQAGRVADDLREQAGRVPEIGDRLKEMHRTAGGIGRTGRVGTTGSLPSAPKPPALG